MILPLSLDPMKADGRANVIAMHPDFRMIVLANRPGFPFLGNDFFGALGKTSVTGHIFFLTLTVFRIIVKTNINDTTTARILICFQVLFIRTVEMRSM